MNIGKIILTENDCYKAGKKITPKGIVVHSTGANNKNLKRYIQPDDGVIGTNQYKNDWNRPGIQKCVHAFIGVDKNGDVKIYQTLPWEMRCWGCGSGKKGSYNNSHIQFEICEDALTDEQYFNKAMDAAAELCAYLVKTYSIDVANVVSHNEAYQLGYASGHADCDHWLKKFNKNMDWFRDLLRKKAGNVVTTTSPAFSMPAYKVKVTGSALNIRSLPSTSSKIVGCIRNYGVYTIVETKGNWGKLKSGAGWICLDYTKRI